MGRRSFLLVVFLAPASAQQQHPKQAEFDHFSHALSRFVAKANEFILTLTGRNSVSYGDLMASDNLWKEADRRWRKLIGR